MDIALLIDMSALGRAAKTSAWLYPLANVGHFLGVGLLFGPIVLFDWAVVRGQAARVADLGLQRVAAIGVLIMLATGPVLLAADAQRLLATDAFVLKLVLIALALANIALFHAIAHAGGRIQTLSAGLSMALWFAVIVIGGLVPYL